MRYSLLALIPALVFCSCEKPSNHDEALRDINESNDELVEALKEGMSEETGLTIDPEALQKHQQGLEEAASKIDGKLGEAMAVTAELNKAVNQISIELNEKAMEFAKIMDFSDLAESENYDERRKFFADYADYNREVLEFYTDTPSRLEKRLDEIDFKGKERKEFQQGFHSSFDPMLEQIRIIRGVDIDICGVSTKMLDLLEDEQGEWQWTEDGPVFESDEAVEIYNKFSAIFMEEADKQMKAQQKVIEIMSR